MNIVDIRKSNMDISKLHFWTATINNWYKLLEEDVFKAVVISNYTNLIY